MSAVDDYLEQVNPMQRIELERIRKVIKEVAPNAEETISYRMPTFKVNGKPLVYFAVFKNHLSLFPTSKPIDRLKVKLSEYKVSRGGIQFSLEKPLPRELIIELLQIRLADIVSRT